MAMTVDGGIATFLDLTHHEQSTLQVTGVHGHYPAQTHVPAHQHDCYHLLYAAEGLMRVEADSGEWLLPPTTAVWLRPQTDHAFFTYSQVRAHGLFIKAEISNHLADQDAVLHVSPLLRELIIALSQDTFTPPTLSRRHQLLSELLLEELQQQQPLPCYLPWPADPAMAQVCDALTANLSHSFTANDWADRLAMSSKSFHRHFERSTGMTFGRWRQQCRLLHSLPMLLDDAPIVSVALTCGYDSHSAYSVAFKKHFGVSPSSFVAATRQA
ncbi:AraC family transcriptional regulator [Alcaligenaceae bacterium 429]|nr:AraC family transcriptional regulator [Alcaligenaceae bacterium 429]